MFQTSLEMVALVTNGQACRDRNNVSNGGIIRAID